MSLWERKKNGLMRLIESSDIKENYVGEVAQTILLSDPDTEHYSNSYWLLRCLMGTTKWKATESLRDIAYKPNIMTLSLFRKLAVINGSYDKSWSLYQHKSFQDLKDTISRYAIYDFHGVGFCANGDVIEVYGNPNRNSHPVMQAVIDQNGITLLNEDFDLSDSYAVQDILFLMGRPLSGPRQDILMSLFQAEDYSDRQRILFSIVRTMAYASPHFLASLINKGMPNALATKSREALYKASQSPIPRQETNMIILETWRKHWSSGHVHVYPIPRQNEG